MAEDWALDVRKYVPGADAGVIAGIVRHCGIALHSHDASLVAFSDKAETDRVRESFLKKTLGLHDADDVMNGAIAAVGAQMQGDHTKNRVTVYYLLARHFGKLGMFAHAETAAMDDGVVGNAAIGAGLGAAAMLGGGELGMPLAIFPDTTPIAEPITPVAPVSAAPEYPSPRYPATADRVGPSTGGLRWLPWLVLLAAILGLLWYLFGNRQPAAVSPPGPIPALPAPAAPMAIPTGAGLTSEVRAGKPMVTVYFDTGKSAVVPAFGAAGAVLKTFVDSHPGTKLSVSGYNDPTGNAAANAELSKDRAKAVQAALSADKVPTDAIVLEKPADTTDTADTKAQARRVEIVIK